MDKQLILQFQTKSLDDYDAVIEFEDKLIDLLKVYSNVEVDGHDVDEEKINIFLYTSDPSLIFQKIQNSSFFRTNNLISKVIYRDVGEDDISVLWPSNLSHFSI